ncbi:MAG: hypothetical protein NUV52_00205, partial [Candidatus Roizmanbacteria bacterium]|nr:hypothetical protein [Candidatus Roizmanbacteria bacterium]
MTIETGHPTHRDGLEEIVHNGVVYNVAHYVDTNYPDRLPAKAIHTLGTMVAQFNDQIQMITSEHPEAQRELSSILEKRNTIAGLIATRHAYIAEAVVTKKIEEGVVGNNPMVADELKQEALLELWSVACKHDPRINEVRGMRSDLLARFWSRAEYVVEGALADELGIERSALARLISYKKAVMETIHNADMEPVMNSTDIGTHINRKEILKKLAGLDKKLYGQVLRIISLLPAVQSGLEFQDASEENVRSQAQTQMQEGEVEQELLALLVDRERAGLNPTSHKILRDMYRERGGRLEPHPSDNERYQQHYERF